VSGKLDTADAFDRMFSLYGRQFTVLIGTALAIFIPVGVVSGVLAALVGVAVIPVIVILALIGQALYTGAVVEAVADMRDGRRDFSIGALLRAAAPFVWALLGAGLLYALVVVIGFILLIVPGLVFLTWFALVAPAMVVERRRVMDSFSRSRELVRGNGWRVFGVIVVAVIIRGVVQSLFQRLGVGIGDDVGAAILGIVGQVLTAPVLGLAVSVVYFDLRDIQQGTRPGAETVPPPPAAL
jgi:hypothetical protein